MTTYTFLKALELLISKMGRSTAEISFPMEKIHKNYLFIMKNMYILQNIRCYSIPSSNKSALRSCGRAHYQSLEGPGLELCQDPIFVAMAFNLHGCKSSQIYLINDKIPHF